MFSRLSAVVTLSVFTILAAAAPNGGNPPATTTVTVTETSFPTATQPASQCNTGPVQCCNSVQSSNDSATATLLSLLGIVLQGVNVPIGLGCSPISVIGVGGNSCSAQPVCCENNNFNGLVAIGCTPVNINL